MDKTSHEIINLLAWIMLGLGLRYEGLAGAALFDAFQGYLIDQYRLGKSVLLIADEAQNLRADALESLRTLSNVNGAKNQLPQIMLVEQPQLKDMLTRTDLIQFSKRVEFDFHLRPFATDDMHHHIEHRLAIAGQQIPLFTDEAVAKIGEASQGVPRRINVLCNTALIYGFAAESKYIDLDLVEVVLRDKVELGRYSASNKFH